jgi:hypothetical protein
MTTIRYRENQYLGINAHLHSYLQAEFGEWEVFHGVHVTHLAEVVNAVLPSGYRVKPEKSMQVREYHPDTGEPIRMKKQPRPKPDLAVLESVGTVRETAPTIVEAAPTHILELVTTIQDDPAHYLNAVVIQELQTGMSQGKPVVWLELLSPTNKGSGAGALQYQEKRLTALRAGLILVELDYVHETPPVLANVPSYADQETDAAPFLISVTIPRPTLQKGKTELYAMRVDDPLPIVKIPLLRDDTFKLDFAAAYRHTFESLDIFGDYVDYAREPLNFERYLPADQTEIRARMASVQALYATETKG